MTKILIPRSDSISAKIIEPSDFEKLNSDDIVPDYKKTGFTLSAGSGLAVNVSTGVIRLKGLYLESSASETVSSLTASDVNYIYVKLARDNASEAESWDFFKNLTGTTPTDAFFIGTATTDGSAVTAVDQSDVIDIAIPKFEHMYFGDGVNGDVTLSTNTNVGEVKHYNNLTINSGVTLTSTASTEATLIIKVKNTLTINGTVSMDGKGGAGGAGISGGSGGAGGLKSPSGQGHPPTPHHGKLGTTGDLGGLGQIGNNDTHKLESGSGGSGAGGIGGLMPVGWASVIKWSDGFDSDYYETLSDDTVKGMVLQKPGALHLRNQPGLANVPNTRLNDPFYIATQLPQFFGSGGSGGTSGGGGQGGQSDSQSANTNGGVGGTGGTSQAGGNGGGGIIICAKDIVIANTGVITADGANGTAGGAGGNGSGPVGSGSATASGGQGGGGAGGSGGGEAGQIVLLYETFTNNGSSNITLTAGTGGTAGAAGSPGGSGVNEGVAGEAGGSGGNGTAKTLKQIDLT